METKHTPGPWKWVANGNLLLARDPHPDHHFGASCETVGHDWDECGTLVMQWIIAEDDDGEYVESVNPPDKADADLIAAAPDLFDALLPFAQIDTSGLENHPAFLKQILQARAAIAKATGEIK